MWESVDVPQKCVLVVVLKAARALFPNGAAELKGGTMVEAPRGAPRARGEGSGRGQVAAVQIQVRGDPHNFSFSDEPVQQNRGGRLASSRQAVRVFLGGGATWATAATDEHVQDQPFLPRRPARRFSASRAPILSIPNSCVMCRRPRSRSRARSSGRSSCELETRNSQGKRRASSL